MGVFETDADDIRDALKTLNVPALKTEAQYEKAIYDHLHTVFPLDVFHRQYAYAKTKADIYVEFHKGAHVVVEVKRNLTTRAEYHRLIGQSWEYMREWQAELVVCLCGECDPSLIKLVAEAVGALASTQRKKAHVLAIA